MNEKLYTVVLKNLLGQVVRTLKWSGKDSHLVHRFDKGRLELCENLQDLQESGVKFLVLQSVELSTIQSGPLTIAGFGTLGFPLDTEEYQDNTQVEKEDSRVWWQSLAMVFVGAAISIYTIYSVDITEEALKEELREHVVKVIKRRPPKRVVTVPASQFYNTKPTQQPTQKVKQRSVKRMGALAVLGSLKRSNQKGGVNLGQVQVSRGPGLGGTQGSGGVQTSLYGKGLVAAPVGVGGNIKGAGGYGTKGKGGGQAGYGQLSLVGSSGTDLIPLGKEAIINGGLDRDLIAAVIQRNMGQVRFCYERGLQSDPKLSGRVAVRFTIGADGRVKVADVGNTTLHSKLVEDCILLRLKSWKFPLPEGGLDVKVSYPFMLKRQGQS